MATAHSASQGTVRPALKPAAQGPHLVSEPEGEAREERGHGGDQGDLGQGLPHAAAGALRKGEVPLGPPAVVCMVHTDVRDLSCQRIVVPQMRSDHARTALQVRFENAHHLCMQHIMPACRQHAPWYDARVCPRQHGEACRVPILASELSGGILLPRGGFLPGSAMSRGSFCGSSSRALTLFLLVRINVGASARRAAGLVQVPVLVPLLGQRQLLRHRILCAGRQPALCTGQERLQRSPALAKHSASLFQFWRSAFR